MYDSTIDWDYRLYLPLNDKVRTGSDIVVVAGGGCGVVGCLCGCMIYPV